jgi:purine nucleosidase
LPDPVAMSIALDPGVCNSASEHLVDVEAGSELTRGMTLVDRLDVAGDVRNADVWRDVKKMKVCWTIDVPQWKRALIDALSSRGL